MIKLNARSSLNLLVALLLAGQLILGDTTLVRADDPKSKLELAYDQSDSRLFQELIHDHRKEINQPLSHGQFGYLHACAMSGAHRIAQCLVAADADLEIKDQQGRTALMIASSVGGGRIDVYYLLLQAGADVKAADPVGNQPLHFQAKNCHLDTIHLLLKAGANPNATNLAGETPLHLIATSKHAWAACGVEMLIDGGADPALKTKDGKTAMEIASARNDLPEGLTAALEGKPYKLPNELSERLVADPSNACKNGAVGMLTIAMKHNPKLIRWQDANGFNMLHIAAIGGSLPVLELLVENKLNVNEPVARLPNSPSGGASVGKTALHFAADRGHQSAVEFLLTSKANPNVVDPNGNTPLHAACESMLPSFETVDLLLKSKAQLRQNNNGGSPLHALVRGSGRVIEGAKSNPKFYRPEEDFETRQRIAELLLRKRHPVDMIETSGNTPLHVAAMSGSAPFVKWLLKMKANPMQPNQSGKKPFELSSNPDVQQAFRGH